MAKIAEHYVEISGKIDKLDKALQKGQNKISNFSKIASRLGGVMAGAFAADRIVRFGAEVSKMAAEAEGVTDAFKRLGGDAILDDLQKATRGTVSNLELMRKSVEAKNFDIPLKDLASLFEFATKRAQQTGQSVDYLVNSIVLGIGRKSPLILDNLGISAIRLRKELKGAGTEAATVGDVAAAVGKIAQQEMAKAGAITETTAIKTARWGAAMKNIQVTIGSGINKALNALAPTIDKAFKGLVAVMPKIRKFFIDLINYFIRLYNESTFFRGVINKLAATFKTLWEIVKLVFNNIMTGFKNIGAIVNAILTGNFKEAFKNIKDNFSESIQDFKDFGSNVGQAYKDGWESTFTPKEQLKLVGLDDESVGQIVAKAGELGGKVAMAIQDGPAARGPSESTMGPGASPDVNPVSFMSEENLQMMVDNFNQAFTTIGSYLTNLFENFAQAFTEGENVLKKFLDYFKKWALGIIMQIAAIAAAAAVLSIITGGSFGGIFKSLFGQSGFGQAFNAAKAAGQAGKQLGAPALNAVVKGSDLHFVLSEYNRQQGNTR